MNKKKNQEYENTLIKECEAIFENIFDNLNLYFD